MSRMLGLGLVLSVVVAAGAVILDPWVHEPITGRYRVNDPAPILRPSIDSVAPAASGDDYTGYALAAAPPALASRSVPITYPPGDTNCDGIVSAADIDALVCRLSNPGAKPPADRGWHGRSCWGQSDLNRDAEITYADLELLTTYLGAAQSQR